MNFLIPLVAAIAIPSADVDVGFATRQMKFGNAEKDGAVGTVEAEAKWYGVGFSAEWVYDHEGGRELTVGPSGEYTFFDAVTASAQYLLESHPSRVEENTAYVVPRLQGECFLRPSIEWWLDVDSSRGASYWSADIGHTFKLTERISADIDGGTGIGNSLRNRKDADFSSFGFKDIHATASLSYSISESMSVSPWLSAIHRFRHGEDGCDDFLFVAGANLCYEF